MIINGEELIEITRREAVKCNDEPYMCTCGVFALQEKIKELRAQLNQVIKAHNKSNVAFEKLERIRMCEDINER